MNTAQLYHGVAQREAGLLRTCIYTHEKESDYMSAMIAPELTAQVGGGAARLRGPKHGLCGWTVFCNYEHLGGFLGSDGSGPSFPSGSRRGLESSWQRTSPHSAIPALTYFIEPEPNGSAPDVCMLCGGVIFPADLAH